VAEVARTRSVGFRATGGWIGHFLDSEKVFGYVLVAPAVAYIVLLVGYPFAIALWFTVSNATVAHPIANFTGLTNLVAVLDDGIFRRALINTFIFTLTSQALQMVLGTILAFLLLRKFRGRRIARALIMIPFTIPIAIGAMAWTWMLNPTYSVINWVLVHAGLLTQGPNWLGEEYPAMFSIILVNVWRNLPFTAIVLTAGISAVPQEIIEAASLDGASWLVRWRKVMVPIIARVHLHRHDRCLAHDERQPRGCDARHRLVCVPDGRRRGIARPGRHDVALPLPGHARGRHRHPS